MDEEVTGFLQRLRSKSAPAGAVVAAKEVEFTSPAAPLVWAATKKGKPKSLPPGPPSGSGPQERVTLVDGMIRQRREVIGHKGLPANFEEKLEVIQHHLSRGLSKTDAAIMAGVPLEELTAWMREASIESRHEDPEVERVRERFRAAKALMRQAEIKLQGDLADVLIQAAKEDGNVHAAQIVLERRFPKSWGKETKVTHKGKVEHTHVHSGRVSLAPGALSDEDLAILEGVLERQSLDADTLKALPPPGAEDAELLEPDE